MYLPTKHSHRVVPSLSMALGSQISTTSDTLVRSDLVSDLALFLGGSGLMSLISHGPGIKLYLLSSYGMINSYAIRIELRFNAILRS
jgi:hypothetical protein